MGVLRLLVTCVRARAGECVGPPEANEDVQARLGRREARVRNVLSYLSIQLFIFFCYLYSFFLHPSIDRSMYSLCS